MLLRFDAVEEIGRFAALKHKAEQFSRLSLIFARNGFGKSTLCAVLRSASEGQADYISARRRLDAKKESRVQSTWASGATVAFGAGKWNSCPGKVYVFDQEFVHQNLHVGESVTRENKRSLLPVVLGEQGVVLAKKILDLDQEQRDLARTMSKHAAVIYAKCPVVAVEDISAFAAKEIPADTQQRIEHAERGVQLAKQAVTVQQKATLKMIELPSLEQFREIAGRTIASVSLDANAKVRQHIDAHSLGAHGDRWLKYGAEHLVGASCPFCDQDVSSNALVAAYGTYFSEAFTQLLSDRDSAISAIDGLLTEGEIFKTVVTNSVDAAFWSQVCEMPVVSDWNSTQHEAIVIGLSALRSLLETKVANPLQSVGLTGHEESIAAAFTIIGQHNDLIGRCRSAIETAKADAQGADLKKAERIRSQWLALADKVADPVKSAASGYTEGEARKKAIEAEKKAAQSALTTYAKGAMKARQEHINDLLAAFGASFTIADAKANFRGREPNTDYAISIGTSTLQVGDRSDTEPSFKTVLSAGDKTTLALAFFIAQVLSDPNLADAVVVFDDPFNSQDMGRQFETTSQVRAIAKNACQTIVFSHDPRFLGMIEKDADAATTRTFQLMCSDSGQGTISYWSSAAELKSLYVRQAEMIREYASQGTLLKDETPQSVLQAIRPFLEDYIKARFPGRFAAHDQIVPMTEAIKAAGADDPLYGFVDDLLALNEYTRVNMHGGAQAPDPVALRAQTKKVLALVGRY